MKKPKKDTKKEKWIHLNPSVRVPYFLMAHDVWEDLSGSAVKLYLAFRKAFKDPDNGFRNTVSESRISFGPADVPYMNQRTYYRALNELLEVGLISKVSCGSHGKKAVYNLLSVEWMSYERRGRTCAANTS